MKTKFISILFLLTTVIFFSCNEKKGNNLQNNIFLNPELVDNVPELLTTEKDFPAELNKTLPADFIYKNYGSGNHQFFLKLMIDREGNVKNIELEKYVGLGDIHKVNNTPLMSKLAVFLSQLKFNPAKKDGKNVGSSSDIRISITLNQNGRIETPWQLLFGLSEKMKTSEYKQGEDQAYTYVDQMPEYPGGTDALLKFIDSNIKYPAEAKQKGVEGKVFVQFIVSKTGDIVGIKVIKGIESGCDDEAVRVCKMMHRWIPGRLNGKPVPVKIVIPFHFKLE
jgi:TonB family protein